VSASPVTYVLQTFQSDTKQILAPPIGAYSNIRPVLKGGAEDIMFGESPLDPLHFDDSSNETTSENTVDLNTSKPDEKSDASQSNKTVHSNPNTATMDPLAHLRSPTPMSDQERVHEREFRLTASFSNFDHEANIRSQPYYNGFKPDVTSNIAQELEAAGALQGSWAGGKSAQQQDRDISRARRLQMREIANAKRVSLMELWSQGVREREAKEREST
jgi:hypothetical protein